MTSTAPSFVMVSPNYVEPGILMPYVQHSGALDCLAGGGPRISLSEGDLYVYMKRLELRTRMAGGQAAYNQLPSISTSFSQIMTPTYLIRVRGEYDHHDQAAMGRWGASIQEVQRLGSRQGAFQLIRNALLYGFNPVEGEGLLNAQGATTVNLPPDSNGNQTVDSYDSGQMAIFFLGLISSLKTRTMQLGEGRQIVILGPQRVLSQFEYQGIVQLTQFQRAGAGTASAAGMIKAVAGDNEDTIWWLYDDTLQGKGANGTDAVLVVMPEVKQMNGGVIDTNEFAKLQPGINANTLMYADMAAPREIPTPLAGGAIDTLYEMRVTSGWAVRPEAVTIVSMPVQ